MKKTGKNVAVIGLGSVLIAGVTALTIFSSVSLVRHLNADADMKYVAALNESALRTMPDDRGNDNLDITQDGPSKDGSTLEDQLSDDNSSLEETASQPSDTEVSADDSEAVTYPYYIGTEFVVVDPEGNMVYLVQKGDTLSEVSGMLGYSVDELAEYNNISNVNLIYAAESLRIPASPDLVETVKKYVEGRQTEASGEVVEESAPDTDESNDGTSSQQP